MAKAIAIFFILLGITPPCTALKITPKNSVVKACFQWATTVNANIIMAIYEKKEEFIPLAKFVTQPLFNALEKDETDLFISLYSWYCNNHKNRQIAHDGKNRTLLEVALEKQNLQAINAILISWKNHFNLFDSGYEQGNGRNIFHKILEPKMPIKKHLLANTVLTGLLQCLRCSITLINSMDDNGKTPLDQALDQKIDPEFGQMVIYSCTDSYASSDEIKAFILEKTMLAKKNHLWESVASLLKKYPYLCSAKELFEQQDHASQELFYKSMILVGFDLTKLQPSNETTDPLLETYKKKYRPNLTASTLYFWTNLSRLNTTPSKPDILVCFYKNKGIAHS